MNQFIIKVGGSAFEYSREAMKTGLDLQMKTNLLVEMKMKHRELKKMN